MNLAVPSLLAPLLLLSSLSCQRPFLSDDGEPPTANSNWQQVDYQSERLILGLHTTPFEWYVISENQFSRFDSENQLLEKRTLLSNGGAKGTPAMSDNTFFRLTINDDASQVAEFHLARNPSEVFKIPVDSLVGPGDSFIEVDVFARKLGAFSSDGTLFMLPATVLPGRHYVLLLFEVLHNPSHNSFASIEMVKRIELESLSADVANLNNIRFFDGNFYATSKEGAWRVTPSGETEKIFYQWMLDCFSWQGDLYATGSNSFDLHKSTDNGLTWERLNQNSDLQFVETAGEYIFTHLVLGHPFKVVDGDGLGTAFDFAYPSGAPASTSVTFYAVGAFADNYYFTMDKSVYVTDGIVVE